MKIYFAGRGTIGGIKGIPKNEGIFVHNIKIKRLISYFEILEQKRVKQMFLFRKKKIKMAVTKPDIFIDSVPDYTPILIKYNDSKWGDIDILPIEELASFKKEEKECVPVNKMYVWLNLYYDGQNGTKLRRKWTRIKRIQRHYYSGSLRRVNCHTGLVDTSPNHSLFNHNGKEVDAKNVKPGNNILIKNNYPVRKYGTFIGSEDLAWVYGMFAAKGSVTKRTDRNGSEIRIVSNKDKKIIERVKRIVKKEMHLDMTDYKSKDGCYECSIYNRKIAKRFRKWFYTKNGFKKVPRVILNAPTNVKMAFLRGYYAENGTKPIAQKQEFVSCTTNFQILAAGILYLISQTTKQRTTILEEGEGYYRLMFNSNNKTNKGKHLVKRSDVVKTNRKIKYEGYVYDIETDSQRFSGGIGSVILKNSGAFSIYTRIIKKNRSITDSSYINTPEFKDYLNSYIEFCHKYKKYLNVYANVDVIGDGKKTFIVHREMEKQGLRPLPVYHYGEHIKWLHKYIDKGYDYIALGGIVGDKRDRKHKISWIRKVFSEIQGKNIKLHGFAITSIKMLTEFPFYSVDSTSWIQIASNGAILVPPDLFNQSAWDKPIIEITMSEKSVGAKNHYTKLPKKYKIRLAWYLEKIGIKYFNNGKRYTIKKLSSVQKAYEFRIEVCAIFYKEIEDYFNKVNRDEINKVNTLV